MDTTQQSAYQYVQQLFQRGLVTVVGSGASCAYGLPSMGALATHLINHVPDSIAPDADDCRTAWQEISKKLSEGIDLESSLSNGTAPEALVESITSLVTECVETSEASAISTIINSAELTPFGRLFQHILLTTDSIDVITTNYDRLIEVHAAHAGVSVDSMFFGHTIGRLDGKRSREELLQHRAKVGSPKHAIVSHRPHLRLSKPHGSLDWYTRDDAHYRSDLRLSGQRRIVAPGASKYRIGYESPFDVHRTRANEAIDQASALLFIGYGFNDEHLQTHIRPRLPQVPTVVLSRELTANAREYLATNRNAIGIESAEDGSASTITQGTNTIQVEAPLWALDTLLKEVLKI